MPFDQYPCSHQQSYSYAVYDALGNQIALPSFISILIETVTISSPKWEDRGEYRLIFCSQIIDLKECAALTIEIFNILPDEDGLDLFDKDSGSTDQ